MDRRLALALLLSGLAVIVSSMLFPPAPRRTPPPTGPAPDSAAAVPQMPVPPRLDSTAGAGGADPQVADTLVVQTQKALYRFTTLGATAVDVALPEYRALNRDSGAVRLIRDSAPLVAYRLVAGRDTVLAYRFERDGYLLKVDGRVPAGVEEVVITLPRGLRSEEADLKDDRRYLAFALKPVRNDARSIDFSKL